MYQRIFVPVDCTSAKQAMLEEAIRLAKFCHGASIRLVHVLDLASIETVKVEVIGTTAEETIEEDVRKSAYRVLNESIQKAREAGLTPESVLLEAKGHDLAAAIQEDAKQWDADLIVMGTHGHGGLYHLVMGSVAEGVVRHASAPVMLVHSRN